MKYPNPFLCTKDMIEGAEDILIPGKWYWYDEAEQLNEEPFDTEEAAKADLMKYVKTL